MILGLSGKALSGKDTVADYLIERHNFPYKTGFAYNLKISCMRLFGLTEDQVFSQEGKSSVFSVPLITTYDDIYNILGWMRKTHDISIHDKDYNKLIGKKLYSPRDILQFVGTEVMRFYASDYHMEVIFRSVKNTDSVIITDVRFPNESQAVLDNGGKIVRILRPDSLRSKHGIILDSSHESEVALDSWTKWSYVIDNYGETTESLYREVDKMLEAIKI